MMDCRAAQRLRQDAWKRLSQEWKDDPEACFAFGFEAGLDAVAPRVEPPVTESGAGFESLPASVQGLKNSPKHTPKTNNSNNFKQPKALRLADALEREYSGCHTDEDDFLEMDAAAELRRLYAEVDSLSYRLAYPDNFAREWVGLSIDDIERLSKWADKHGYGPWYLKFARAIEDELREKNQ
jgi:hypothetical protein